MHGYLILIKPKLFIPSGLPASTSNATTFILIKARHNLAFRVIMLIQFNQDDKMQT